MTFGKTVKMTILVGHTYFATFNYVLE